MQKIDLQVQTTASDGKHTPREAVQMAKANGVEVIAITDHDTIAGVEEAMDEGGKLGVRVISGIEISVEEYGAHILGLGIDHKNERLAEFIGRFKEERILRLKKLMENLKRNEGFFVEWEDVLKEAGMAATLTSPHLVYAVIKKTENQEKLLRDGVKSKQDFYSKYLVSGGPNDEKREHFSAKQAIELIHEARGLAFWSHPAVHFNGDYDELEKFLADLVGWKIDGVEVFSSAHTEDDVEFLEGLTRKYGLLCSAGSDFHEVAVHTPNEQGLHSADTIGDFQTFGFSVDQVVTKLDSAMQKK